MPLPRKGYFSPPVIVILALITFGVALTLFLNADLVKNIKNKQTPIPQPATQQSPSPSPDETVNLTEFKYKPSVNSVFKDSFSFYYPNDLQVTKISDINLVSTSGLPEIIIAKDKITSVNEVNNLNSCVKIYVSFGYANSQDALESINGGTFDTSLKADILKSENIIISNISGTKRLVKHLKEQQNTYEAVVMRNQASYYFRTCSVADVKRFDQILSTFKFL